MARTKYYPPSVIRQRTVAEGGRVYNDWKQPGRREILKENLRQQADSGSVRKNVRMAMDIPILDREVLIKKYPEALKYGDRKAIDRFLHSSEGRPYRTSPRGRTRPFSFGGI